MVENKHYLMSILWYNIINKCQSFKIIINGVLHCRGGVHEEEGSS